MDESYNNGKNDAEPCKEPRLHETNISEDDEENQETEYSPRFRHLPPIGSLYDCENARQGIQNHIVSHDKLNELEPCGLLDYRLAPRRNRNEVLLAHYFIVKPDGDPSKLEDRLYFYTCFESCINCDKKANQLSSLAADFTVFCPLRLLDEKFGVVPFEPEYVKAILMESIEIKRLFSKWVNILTADEVVFITYSYNYSIGCPHYIIQCEAQCFECKGFFGCRLCHEDTMKNVNALKILDDYDDDIIPRENALLTKKDKEDLFCIDYTKTFFRENDVDKCKKIVEEIERKIVELKEPPLNSIPDAEEKNGDDSAEGISGEEEDDGLDLFIGDSHLFDRYATDTVKCIMCRKIQPFGGKCIECGTEFGNYKCDECKLLLFIPNVLTNTHCDKCRTCYIGLEGASIHCDVCKSCVPYVLRKSHKCAQIDENTLCCICNEALYSSTLGAYPLDCGIHSVHATCYEQMMRATPGFITCPVCKKTLKITYDDEMKIKLEKLWLYPYNMISQCNLFLSLECNDCKTNFVSNWNLFSVYRCSNPKCCSFNCTVLTVLPQDFTTTALTYQKFFAQNEALKKADCKQQPLSVAFKQKITEKEMCAITEQLMSEATDDIIVDAMARYHFFLQNERYKPTEKELAEFTKEHQTSFEWVNRHIKLIDFANILSNAARSTLKGSRNRQEEDEEEGDDMFFDNGADMLD